MRISIKPSSSIKAGAINTRNFLNARGRTKVFCIGRNKTGTTSLAMALSDLGFVLGHQATAERLTDRYYFSRDFRPIIAYCHFGQAFQDVPFSWPDTYRHLDAAFPQSKFILTVRQSSDEWYRSISRFHAKKFGQNGQLPTALDLKRAGYRRPGFMYNTVRVHGTPDDDPYNRGMMKEHYERHNADVKAHFRGRPKQLLVLDVAAEGAYQRLIDFLGVDSSRTRFPWENKT